MKTKAIILLFLLPFLLLAGNSEKEADHLFKSHKYFEALTIYKKLIKENPDKIDLHFKIGMCYYNLPEQTNRATFQFEQYLQKTDSIYEAYYLLGKLYHKSMRFEDAITQYNKYLIKLENDPELTDKLIKNLRKKVVRDIEYAENGLILINNFKKVTIENLGAEINTEYDEYGAVFSDDEKLLIFTGRYPENNKLDIDGRYFEDIYYVTLEEGNIFDAAKLDTIETENGMEIVSSFKFSAPKKMRKGINTDKHDASIQLTPDGKKLYIFREGDIWITTKNDTGWTLPVKIPDNTKYFEPSLFINAAEDIKIIASEREGGKGGLDLYWSKKNANGTWLPFKNMGDSINTPYNEDSPFLTFNDSVLYFSSTGHNSMGEYDIFKSKLINDSTWSKPENLGFPINSPDNDVFYFTNTFEDKAYFSSDRIGGYGKTDIYRLSFDDTTGGGFVTVIDTSYGYEELPLDSHYIKELMTENFEEVLRLWGDKKVEDLYYKVQIAAFKVPKNFRDDKYKELGKIERMRIDGITRFLVGHFETLNEAYKHRQLAREKGITDAFIVAIYKGKRILLEDLILSRFNPK